MTLLKTLVAAALLTTCLGALASGRWDDPASTLPASATSGDARALTELAVRYENAEGMPKDQAMANRLYCRAARDGYSEAQFRLGWAYANGRGGLRDDAVAAALFALAAAQGHEYAARLLAYLPEPDRTRLPQCMLPDPPVAASGAAARHARGDRPVSMRGKGASELGAVSRVPPAIRQIVHQLAPQYEVDTELVLAVIAVESDFDALAVSPRNAQGLMQLIPETAARFGVKRPFNAVDNIKGGLAYLRWLLAFFEGDVRLVLAAYNAGERAVERYRGIPPYAETRDYVRKISAIYPKNTHPYEPSVVRPSPLAARKRGAE